MKIMISIQHPAWAHQFKHIIKMLQARGDDVLVLAIDKDNDLELLDAYGIEYKLVGSNKSGGVVKKAFMLLWLTLKFSAIAIKYKPDYLIGRYSAMLAIASRVVGKKHIIYEDTEADRFSLNVCRIFSYKIITSDSFLLDLGKKQERVDTYKELFYLHPKYFTPQKEKLLSAGINPDEKYVVFRWVAWRAVHDRGRTGISDEFMVKMVTEIARYAKVYISSEKEIPKELEKYKINLPFEDVHHLLKYAHLYIGESATMASESAVLGTHAIYLNSIACGSTNELEKKYHLVYNYNDDGDERYEKGLEKAKELLADPELYEVGNQKLEVLLKDKMDINEYFISNLV